MARTMTDGEVRTHHDRDPGLVARTIIGTLAVVAIVVLAIDNRREVKVSWVFGDVDTSLWVVLVLAAAAGAVIGWLLTHRPRRHRS
jgi:uncharacterized integral membrane protein